MVLLVLLCLSGDGLIKPSTDEQNNINKNINRSTKQHQQIDKTTPTNKQINISLSVDVLIYVDLSICWCCFVYLLMLFCRSGDVFIDVVLFIC
jgi:hypothetical protein